MKEKRKENTDTYFLDNNCELKVILSTMPHYKIYIKNQNGKLIVSENSTMKNKCKKNSN